VGETTGGGFETLGGDKTSKALPRKSQSSLQVCFFFPVASFSFIAK